MARHILTLANEAVRERAVRWIRALPPGTRVEFREPARSLEQNALLWALLADLAKQVNWHGQHLSADDWKDVLTASLRRARIVPGIDPGSFVVLGLRTSKMGRAEFSDLIELIHAFGAEQGVVWSDPTLTASDPRQSREAA